MTKEQERISNIKKLLGELHYLRGANIDLKDIYDKRMSEFKETNKELVLALEENHSNTGIVESTIRDIALDQYASTKEKQICFGVGIKVMKELIFDDNNALNWAKQTGLCLMLNTPAFKKIAKVQALDFVVIKDKPTATLPSKIDLGGEEK